MRPADCRRRGVAARGPGAAGVPGTGGDVAAGQRPAHQGAALVVDVQLLNASLEAGADGDVGRDEVEGGYASEVHVLMEDENIQKSSSFQYLSKIFWRIAPYVSA